MKLPSINYLFAQARTAATRYPLTLISALIGVTIGIYLVEYESVTPNIFPLINVMLCSAIGIPLFFCIEVFTDKNNYNKRFRLFFNLGGIVLLGLLFLTLPTSEQTFNTSVPYVRYAIYNLAIHLLVSFAPFIKSKEINGFWQYNKLLFIRLLTSAVYSGFLFVGIVLALASLNILFDVKVNEKLYAEIWIFIVGFFNTWFFVAGMPKNFNELDKVEEYPKGLKIFTQYILLPLLGLYLIILYSYGIKIISLWDWPKGIVSYLITCVAVLGIFNFLLMHPYAKQEGNGWIKWTTKAYYFILIPLVVMLFIAISMRLNDYGITINRYIIYLLGIWLSLVCIYFIIGKTNIKFIPVSLFTVIVLMSFGPWSMFSVSEKSQSNRLKHILEENNFLKDGKLVNEQTITIDTNYNKEIFTPQNQELLNDSLKNEIKSILDYLDDHHGFNSIEEWYTQDFDNQIEGHNLKKERWQRINEAEVYMRALGLDYRHYYTTDNDYVSYSTNSQDQLINIKGYDYETRINGYYYNRNEFNKDENLVTPFSVDSNRYELKANLKNENLITVYKNNEVFSTIDLTKLREHLVKKYGMEQRYDLPQEDLTIVDSTTPFNYKLVLENISFNNEKNKLELNTYNGVIYFKIKEE
jgi:hypothetical protein